MRLPKPQPKIKDPEIFLNFRLPVQTHLKLKRVAKKQGYKSLAAFLRDLIQGIPESK